VVKVHERLLKGHRISPNIRRTTHPPARIPATN
jgi:hypothetical protein